MQLGIVKSLPAVSVYRLSNAWFANSKSQRNSSKMAASSGLNSRVRF